MPRKAAQPATDGSSEPRRSARIKEQPKAEPAPKKAPAKPRGRKPKTPAAAEGEDKEKKEKPAEDTPAEKPKSTKGKKRTAAEKDAEEAVAAPNGAAADEGEKPPPAKKVWTRTRCLCLSLLISPSIASVG